MPSLRSNDLLPIAIIAGITLIAFIAFWNVMDMVMLGGSLAIVLMPLHHHITARSGRPFLSAALITALVFSAFAGTALVTILILRANAGTLTGMFAAVGTWLNDPATNPISYGVPFGKTTLSNLLSTGTAFFIDYE